MTDQPSHLALDSKLAGIVVPHDGRCHLEDNIYSQTTSMVRKTTALDTHKTPDAKLVLIQMYNVSKTSSISGLPQKIPLFFYDIGP